MGAARRERKRRGGGGVEFSNQPLPAKRLKEKVASFDADKQNLLLSLVLKKEAQDLKQERDDFQKNWELLDEERAALLKERGALKHEREVFERRWLLLDEKSAETAKDLKRMTAVKDALAADIAALEKRKCTLAADCAAQKLLQDLTCWECYIHSAERFKEIKQRSNKTSFCYYM